MAAGIRIDLVAIAIYQFGDIGTSGGIDRGRNRRSVGFDDRARRTVSGVPRSIGGRFRETKRINGRVMGCATARSILAVPSDGLRDSPRVDVEEIAGKVSPTGRTSVC